MAEKTTNYGLTKPLPEEFYDVNVQNENMDIIDEEMKKNERALAEHKHTEYAQATHNHDNTYAAKEHDHTGKYAAAQHTHSTNDMTEGVLSLARGGTGVKSIEDLKSILELDIVDPDVYAVRRIKAGTTDMTAGTSALDTGSLYFVYE